MSEANYIAAHKHTSNHRDEIEASDTCGCFYCEETYPPSEIIEWVDDPDPLGMSAWRQKADTVAGPPNVRL